MTNQITSTRRFYLKTKPTAQLTLEHYELRDEPLSALQPGEVLVKTLLISLDAANRAWLQGATYRGEVQQGMPMPGLVIGEVLESQAPQFKVGDLVEGDLGWAEHSVNKAHHLRKRPRVETLTHLISLLGIAGHTAYVGMSHLGAPRAGDTVLVSAAAGAVGSIAAQIARLAGAKVIGLAGTDEKCNWLTKEARLHHAINYKSPHLMKEIAAVAPKGIDLYFDNVGGKVLEAALFLMNTRGRIICCGAVSQYDTDGSAPGPRGVPGLFVIKNLSVQGFVVMNYDYLYPESDARLGAWAAEGSLTLAEDVIHGFEKTPAALIGLLAGENIGKRIIKI